MTGEEGSFMLFAVSIGSDGTGPERYALYLPFILSPGRDIAVEETVSFPLMDYTAQLEKLHQFYAISVGPFSRAELAKEHTAQIKAALLWLSLKDRIGISYSKRMSDITFYDGPVEISERSNLRELARTVGWSFVDGNYDADKSVIRPEHKKLMRWEMGNVAVKAGISVDHFGNRIREALEFPQIKRIGELPKLQLAIELYSACSFEVTDNAQLVTLVTALESLTPRPKIPVCAEDCLREATDLVKAKRDSCDTSSVNWKDLNHLLSRLDNLRAQSIRRSLIAYVSLLVGRASELGDPKEVSARLDHAYSLRSALLHNGIAEQANVKEALEFLREFVPNILTLLFKEEAMASM
jgi:hypothetical protein